MPNFFNKYPYTDFHELNLDWIIKTVKETVAEWAVTLTEWHNTQEEWQQLYTYVHDYFDNLDVQQEINNKIDQMALDGSLATIAQPIINAKVAELLPSEVSSQIGNVVADQIDNVVADQIGDAVSDQVGPLIAPVVTDWLTDNVTPVGGAVVVDDSLTIAGAAADAKITGDKIRNIDNNMPKTDVLYPYSGYINTSGNVVTNPNFFYSDYIPVETLDISAYVYCHSVVATFSFYDADKTYLNEYIKIDAGSGMEALTLDIPNDAVYVRVCTDPTYPNEVYTYMDMKNVINEINGTQEWCGNNGYPATNFYVNFNNFTVCPCKIASRSGQIISLYVKSYTTGITQIYVGSVDQYLLFIPRKMYEISLASGEQTIDVTTLNINIQKGEQLLFKFIGQVPYTTVAGDPIGDTSFYYSNSGTMQLTAYGSPTNAIIFGFGYNIKSSKDTEQDVLIEANSDNISDIMDDISDIQSNLNVISDSAGNKYKLIVQNNTVTPIPLTFRHVLCIGNSYTIHPTLDDTEPDYVNSYWYGHWAMASSTKETAWPSLLQTVLRQKINTAVVTPVFGRRYEMDPAYYTLNNPDTFTYWDGSDWLPLSTNISDFSDVDAIVFFLGANYSGTAWYTLYKAMVEKFMTWFPTASLFCCSCSYVPMTEKDAAIQNVAVEKMASYINLVGINGKSRIGSYVKGDDDQLHQIDNNGVANHFGDYGEYAINGRLSASMGYSNNITLYNIAITNALGVTLSVISTKTISDAIVSVFADIDGGVTLSSVTVTDANSNVIAVTDHGVTAYGRIFTFVMPSSNVSVVANI